MRRLLRLLLPGGLILALGLGLVAFRGDELFEPLTTRYAVVLYAVGGALAAAFHRSRVVAALLALAAVHLLGDRLQPAAPSVATSMPDGLDAAATLLIVLFGVLALVRDRGVTSRGGLAQLGAAGLVAGASYLALADPTRLLPFWELGPLTSPLAETMRIPQTTLLASTIALACTLYGAHRWGGPVERALIWSELLVLASVWPALSFAESSFLLMCTGLLLAVSVLETSYVMAYRDELTGLPARRALMHDLGDIGGTYTLAMVDVDHFKQFNDKHGHDVGDQVLQLVAKHLGDGPGGGKAYRYGGEEFTLVYPGRVKDDARPHADEVRASVENASFSLRAWNRPRTKPKTGSSKKKQKKRKRPKKLSVTVSIGLADSTGKNAEPTDVLKKADEALYRAKRAGRNRVAQ